MTLIRNMIVAFSLYSRIPMPTFEWKDEDLKYNLIFLPWIGAVIGLVEYFIFNLMMSKSLPPIFVMAIISVIPLIVTGGFHVDGFLDVMDALKSYKSKEEKLKILKDPHIGAFAIINLLIYVALWVASVAILIDNYNKSILISFSASFVITRCASAITSVLFKKAKKDGMLHDEAKSSGLNVVIPVVIQMILVLGFLIYVNQTLTILVSVAIVIFVIYYYRLCNKQFGGVSGDTAGFLVTELELVILIAIAAFFLSKM